MDEMHVESIDRPDTAAQEPLAGFRSDLPDGNIKMNKPAAVDFTIFPELPTEIRLLIWRLAPFDARTFRLQQIPDFASPWDETDSDPVSDANPITLQINRESREEGLRQYSVLFEGSNGGKIYFDPHVDRISFRCFYSIDYPVCSHLQKWTWKGKDEVRSLEIVHSVRETYNWRAESEPYITRLNERLGGLVKLTIYPAPHLIAKLLLTKPTHLEQYYDFFERAFQQGTGESNSNKYKAPEITVVGYPRPTISS